MKLNIAYPQNGTVKQFEIHEDQLRRVNLSDYRLGNDIDGALFDERFKGYVFRLKGGSDRQGFPMVQGVMAPSRVSLLLKRGAPGFNKFRGRPGERRRKAVRGCILGPDIAVLNMIIVKTGPNEIEGVTDISVPRRLGPKRVSKLQKLFNFDRKTDVKKLLVKRVVKKDGKRDRIKCAKVQRLLTPKIRARRAHKVVERMEQLRRSTALRREYLSLIAHRRMAARQRKNATLRHQKLSAQKTAQTVQ